MSLGIPVITNKFGLGSIKAEHNQSILLYSSPDELANLICQLRDNSSLLRRIGMGGLSIVDSYYSEAAVRQKICEVISG
jgi:glycosyltransferase involved in cell wall biosynthesis